MTSTNPFIQILTGVIEGLTAAAAEQSDIEGIRIEASTPNQLILRARAERNMTRRELAELSDVSELKLRWYEDDQGRHPFWKPSFDELIAIKRALRIHPDSVRKFL